MKDTLDAMNPAGFFVGATELFEKVTETGKALQRAETQAKNNIVDIDGTVTGTNSRSSGNRGQRPGRRTNGRPAAHFHAGRPD